MAHASNSTDDDLMRQFQAGDVAAFEELVWRYQGPLSAFVRGLTADAATTDDVVQETFVRVWEQHVDYVPTGRFRPWLYTISRNLCYDRFRDPLSRTVDLDMPLILWSGLGAAAQAVRDEGDSRRSEQLDRLAAAAEQLPPLMREAVMLKFYHGLKIREIAEVQACPAGTVKSRLHYALKRIGDMVSDDR